MDRLAGVRLDWVPRSSRRLPAAIVVLTALGVMLAAGPAFAAQRVWVTAPHAAAGVAAPGSHASARRVASASTVAPGNQNVTPGIIPSNDSAGYGWNGSTDPATFSMTFTEPTITCTGANQGYESSVDIGILAQSSAGLGQAGQSTIYAQNFCVLYEPIYRFDLSIPGVPYNGYGYGTAHPGDSITLTDTISSAGTSATYTDNSTGATQTFVGNGGTLQTVQLGLFPIPGSVLAGFNPIAVTGVTLNGAGLGSLTDLGQVNLDQGSTIGVGTSSLAPDETDFTMSYVNGPGPTVAAAAVTNGSTTEVPNGPATGGTPLTITGTNFGNPGDNVSVTLVPQNGSAPVQALDATVVSATEIQAVTADATGSIGSGSTLLTDVEVDVGGVTSTAPQTFTYAKVWVSGVSTTPIILSAPQVPLTITGYGFAGVTKLTFELSNGKGVSIGAKRLTVTGDGTEIALKSPWLPGLWLWLANNFHPLSSYLTDVEVTAGGATSPVDAPDDQVTFMKPPTSP